MCIRDRLTSVSSKVDDLDIPDSFTVEADVTDYEKVEAVTVATNEVFNEVAVSYTHLRNRSAGRIYPCKCSGV